MANLMALGRRRLMLLGGAFVALVLVVLFGLNSVTSPDFTPLYRGLSIASSSSIEATLSGAGFNVEVSEDGSVVSVARSDMSRARMVLAETGIPIDGDPGWELFDDQSGLAMNSFMQRVSLLRAMEGELARSIQTIEGVQSARVHLVLPEREPFSREVPVPRASVIVRPVPGRTLSGKQALGIRNLVASSVADLDLGRVTVLSASGEVILAETGGAEGPETLQTSKATIENRLAQEINSILTARVGAGNARVRVNVELSSERQVIVEQSFNPDQQVIRSTENKSENQTGSDGGGNVGVENNIPETLAGEGDAGSNNSSKSGESVKYEIGNTRRETIREAGEIMRLSVAVLVNGIYAVDNSDVTYSERTAEELDRLSKLVKTAVGFDASRGDTVSVDSMRFMDYSMEVGEPISPTLGRQVTENIVPIIRGLLALAIVGLALVLGVRPMLRHLSQPAADRAEGDQPSASLTDLSAAEAELPAGRDTRGEPRLPGPSGTAAMDILEAAPRDDGPVYVTKSGVQGDLLRSRVEQTQRIADDSPQEVLRVLKSWLSNEAEA